MAKQFLKKWYWFSTQTLGLVGIMPVSIDWPAKICRLRVKDHNAEFTFVLDEKGRVVLDKDGPDGGRHVRNPEEPADLHVTDHTYQGLVGLAGTILNSKLPVVLVDPKKKGSQFYIVLWRTTYSDVPQWAPVRAKNAWEAKLKVGAKTGALDFGVMFDSYFAIEAGSDESEARNLFQGLAQKARCQETAAYSAT